MLLGQNCSRCRVHRVLRADIFLLAGKNEQRPWTELLRIIDNHRARARFCPQPIL